MIEPTDQMGDAYEAARRAYWEALDHEAVGKTVAEHEREAVRQGLAAVLAIVERDYDVTARLPPVEHRMRDGVWWNHYAEQWQAECVCGENFADGWRDATKDRLLDHVERNS